MKGDLSALKSQGAALREEQQDVFDSRISLPSL
jgi:hypothetical protein